MKKFATVEEANQWLTQNHEPIAFLRGEPIYGSKSSCCKICGDPNDHYGLAHSAAPSVQGSALTNRAGITKQASVAYNNRIAVTPGQTISFSSRACDYEAVIRVVSPGVLDVTITDTS